VQLLNINNLEQNEVCAVTEYDLQKATASLLRQLGWLAWHTPNEGAQKKPGVMGGVPDWIIAEEWTHQGRSGSMLAIELKTPNGKVSSAQERWMEQATQRGWLCVVCRSMDEFTAVLKSVKSKNGRSL